MRDHGGIPTAQWLGRLFSSRAAREGRATRRQPRDIDSHIGRTQL